MTAAGRIFVAVHTAGRDAALRLVDASLHGPARSIAEEIASGCRPG